MSGREAARWAASHASLAIENALANGWETLDRYGADRPRVQAALNDLVAELARRAGPVAALPSPAPEPPGPAAEPTAEEPPPLACDESLVAVAQTVSASASAVVAECGELELVRLHAEDYLLLADGRRVGWLRGTGDGWRVHAPGREQPVAGLDGALTGSAAARAGAAALGVPGAQDAEVACRPLRDRHGRIIETSLGSLASWMLQRGRVPGREDVLVRGRCVGWLQPHPAGGYTACTAAGPVPGPPAPSREEAALALFAALYAPAPFPAHDLPAKARTRRRPAARPRRERPISPYTAAQLAAAATDPPRAEGGGYLVTVDDHGDTHTLGRIWRTGRHWQAAGTDQRTVVHRAATRTKAIDRLPTAPGAAVRQPRRHPHPPSA
ncbi:hypothetical protein ACA361_32360 [Actinomadura sp. 21ATH]